MPCCGIILSMDALLLGLASGVVCIGYCAPVLVPYMLGQQAGVAANAGIVARFLAGRLAGYLFFSIAAWVFQASVLRSLVVRDALVGSSYVILSVLLVIYGFSREWAHGCAARNNGPLLARLDKLWPPLVPAALGLMTGLTICPPFLLAFTAAVQKTSLTGSVAFFLLFFCGTSVFFLPFPLIGTLRRFATLSAVGRLAAGIMGLYYFYAGLALLIGVIKKL